MIRNQTRDYVVPKRVAVTDGGFDPVAIEAQAGDELVVSMLVNGDPTVVTIKVPPRRPPTVVRTSPAKGRTDVALNVQVLVVFSEPVEASIKTMSSIRLLHGTDAVSGQVKLSQDGLVAEFIPDTPLQAQTTYSLIVDAGLLDLGGDALVEAVAVNFTTSTSQTSAPVTNVGYVGGFVVSDYQCVLGARVTIMDGPRSGQFATITNCNVWGYDGDEGYLFTDLPLGVPVTLRASAEGYNPAEIRVLPTSVSAGISLTTDIVITKI